MKNFYWRSSEEFLLTKKHHFQPIQLIPEFTWTKAMQLKYKVNSGADPNFPKICPI